MLQIFVRVVKSYEVDLVEECILPDQQSIAEEIQELCDISENKSDHTVSALEGIS